MIFLPDPVLPIDEVEDLVVDEPVTVLPDPEIPVTDDLVISVPPPVIPTDDPSTEEEALISPVDEQDNEEVVCSC